MFYIQTKMFHNIFTIFNEMVFSIVLQNLDELLDHKSNLSDKLCQIGDSIVYKLVQWTKRLPFYLELPVEVHTTLLTHKWHEILVLTTSAYQAIHGQHKFSNVGTDVMGADFMQEVIDFLRFFAFNSFNDRSNRLDSMILNFLFRRSRIYFTKIHGIELRF